MAKQKQTKKAVKRASQSQEPDSTFFLKIVLYLIIGSLWLRIGDSAMTWQLPIPIGLLVGLFYVRSDHFQIDRKIEYAVLLIAMFVGFWTNTGININV